MNQYRLQTLMELRERTEKEKKDQLAESQRKLKVQQQKLDELRKQLDDMKTNRKDKADEFERMYFSNVGFTPTKQRQNENFLKRLDEEIEDFQNFTIKEQEKKVIFAQQEVDWAFEEYTKANQDLKALEKHKEKWKAEIKKEREAKEELAQEEVATTIFLFKK